MNINQLNKKRSRNIENKDVLFEYLYSLKKQNLDTNSSLNPEIENEIRIQVSKLTYEECELLINNFICPGIQVLMNYPNALIGDVIPIVISINTIKNIIYTNDFIQSKIINNLILYKFNKSEPRSINNHISILNSLIESKSILNKMKNYIENFIILIFKELKYQTYFIQKSATKFISLLIKMDIFNKFIFEHFNNFQNDLYNQLIKNNSIPEIQFLEFYKYMIYDTNIRYFLFNNNNYYHHNNHNNHNNHNHNYNHIIHNHSYNDNKIILKKNKLLLLNNYNLNIYQLFIYKLLPNILYHQDKIVSSIGLDIFNIILYDHEFMDFHIITNLFILNEYFIHNFIQNIFSNNIKNENIYYFKIQLNILNIIIQDKKYKYLIQINLIINILKFIIIIIQHYYIIKNNEYFIQNNIFNLLFTTISLFKLFDDNLKDNNYYNNDLIINKTFILNKSNINNISKYNYYILKIIKLILKNLSNISNIFQITQQQIINYTVKILNNNLYYIINNYILFEYKIIFNYELISIYQNIKSKNWELYFLLKCLILLHSDKYDNSYPNEIYNQIIHIINQIIFIQNDLKYDSNNLFQLNKYNIFGPNIILISIELLIIIIKKNNLNQFIFEKGFFIINQFIKLCLNFKNPKYFYKNNEIRYDDYMEFLIYIIKLIKNIDFNNKYQIKFYDNIIQDIFKFSDNGLSSNMLDSIFYLLDIILRYNSYNIEIEYIEKLIQKLLLYYIPNDEINSYQLLYNTYKNICNLYNKDINIISPSLIDDNNIYKKNFNYLNYYYNDENIQIKNIINTFNNCTLDCIGE